MLVLAVAVKLLDRGGGEGSSHPVRVERPAGAAAGPGGHGGALYVHVAGAVKRPGLYRVRAGSRAASAIARAGGPARRADVAAVNLAAPLEDGQQVIVPRAGAGAAGGTGAAGGAAGGKVSLATASPDQLDELDGIGPTLAERIVQYRDSHGGFRSVQELREVEGIGEKRFATLEDAVRP